MLVKIHNSYRSIIAVCDTNLLGKTFEEGNRQIVINPNFFQGEEKTEQDILKLMQDAAAEDSTFNIVGKESVKTALKAGIIKKSGIMKIQGVPVALVLL